MKNYRFLVPIVLIVLTFAGWYSLMNQDASVKAEYNSYLTKARQAADDGLTYAAMTNFESALAVFPNIDVSIEAAEFLVKQKEPNRCIDWCNATLDKYEPNARIYEILAKEYLLVKQPQDCIKILTTAIKRKATNDNIQKLYDAVKYRYDTNTMNVYEEVSTFMEDYCAVKTNGLWGNVNYEGKTIVKCDYTSASGLHKETDVADDDSKLQYLAAVVDREGMAYFVNTHGDKVITNGSNTKYSSFGMIVNGMFPAINKSDGKYSYVNSLLEVKSSGYDFAGSLSNDIGAVKKGNNWQLVKSNGSAINEATYSDIKLDDNNIAIRNDRAFVKADSGYIMVDSAGKQVGTQIYQDARVFADSTYAAVKINKKWGFIDNTGNVIIKPKYTEARSFCNGLAAVKISGTWGYIDKNNKLVIKNQFADAKNFNSNYSAFVNFGNNWQLITLYKSYQLDK